MSKKNMTALIEGFENGKRISTQQLLQKIYEQMDSGVNEFTINASGQHDIGGPLWNDAGKITFRVKNPGQRVGSMGMVGTEIIVDGSAPADVGWLNAGADIIVKGDGGDTTAHCAATGKIYIGGRAGTRSGALMKYDPKFPRPEFWVLKNTGSFSFEFMGGGVGVICGYGCEELPSVLGKRGCVGMVGGTVYVRGPVADLSDDCWLLDLDDADKEFLTDNIPVFLEKIERPELAATISDMGQWRKIVAKTYEERITKSLMPIQDFRLSRWVEGGIFGEVYEDDFRVTKYVNTGDDRLQIPEWMNNSFCAPCEYNCPISIPTQKRVSLLRQGKTAEALSMILDFSPFPGSVCGQVCPNLCMDDCNRKRVDVPVRIGEMGRLSYEIKAPETGKDSGKKVAIIGAGAAGLGAAWHLRLSGHAVEVFEADKVIGGKLKQVIPEERLDPTILDAELKRFDQIGVTFHMETKVDKDLFARLERDFDAVVVAVGAHNPFVLPVEGSEKMVKGLDFLKEINRGQKPNVGEKVVVIGAGNAAMDVVIGAYQMGAKEVTAIDIQKPAAFEKEIEHVEKLGAKILWPRFTEKVTDEGVVLKGGALIEADTVIVAIGDRPDFSFLPAETLDERGKAKVNDRFQLEDRPNVFVPGDALKLGLFTHAVGDGRKVALNIDNLFKGLPLSDFEGAPMIAGERVKNQFYHPMNPSGVEQTETLEDTDRCMSCGWCRDCAFCRDVCPEQAINRVEKPDGTFEYISDSRKCIGCGICAGVCPCGIWTMQDNMEKYLES